jgi:hypothetical protein
LVFPSREAAMRRMLLALAVFLLAASGPALAEEDGEELLALLSAKETREVAHAYVDDVWKRHDGVLFCIDAEPRAEKAYAAVKAYLEANPAQQYRPRRYLIIQGLRQGYPCARP